MALSLLEFFNSGKFVDEKDIEKIDNIFFVSKQRYFKPKTTSKSKVFSIRINLLDSQENINKKFAELKRKIENYRAFK